MKPSFLGWWRQSRSAFRAVLFDIDGTLLNGDRPLPGAAETISRLRAEKFPFCLLTNDGNHSCQEKSVLLRQAGLQIAPEEIVSCGSALDNYVIKNRLCGQRFFVLGALGDPDFAEAAGLAVTRDPAVIDSCAGVIIGEGDYDWQSRFNAVVNTFARNLGRPLVVPNPDSYWPNGPHGEVGIGAGGKARFMVAILAEMGIKLRPIYLGKPYPGIFKQACDLLQSRFGLSSKPSVQQVLMVGDSLRSDILGANRNGHVSALVLSGITSRRQLAAAPGPLRPAYVFQALR